MEAKIKSPGILGIDAGGTFTDLVFLDGKTYEVVAKAKTPTNHKNLARTIEAGLDMILSNVDASAIQSFNLATTLATNAIVEHKNREAALILIGYNHKLVKESNLKENLKTHYVFEIAGGHDERGNEKCPLDEERLVEAIKSIPPHIKSVAISSFFSVRNMSHENRAFELVRSIRPDIYVSRGSELSTDLDSIKRATTTALNAGLIPIVIELISSVEEVCKQKEINVPITILRGDGTIVGADWAKEHPVEMILSGPASSVCGARFLGSKEVDPRGCLVVDIGGTTTDIIRLDGAGRPVLLSEGAKVAEHQTLVKAIDITTFGLGGDTRVMLESERGIYLSNRRVVPLAKLAERYPEVYDELLELSYGSKMEEPLFVLLATDGDAEAFNEFEEKILNHLSKGPVSKQRLLAGEIAPWIAYKELDKMEERGVIEYASFTPTDALHVLGLLDKWNVEASKLGASILGNCLDISPEDVARDVKKKVECKIAKALMVKNFRQSGIFVEPGDACDSMLDGAMASEGELMQHVRLYLGNMLTGVGAPAWAFMPSVGEKVHEKAILPEHAEVAGAVGAAVGSFVLEYPVKITPLKDAELYRVHYPLGVKDFEELDDAIEFTEKFMQDWLLQRAQDAGAKSPRIAMSRHDETAKITKVGREIYFYTELTFSVSDSVAGSK